MSRNDTRSGSRSGLRPFQQLAYRDVPELPRVAHPYASAQTTDVVVPSSAFGPTRIRVRTFGKGPPLLLVHGFMTSSYSFRYVLDSLGAHYSLYVPDLPGAGESDKPSGSYAPDNIAECIGLLMRELDIYGAPVIGNSLGGYLCMRLAMREPACMKKLLNLHSPGAPTTRMLALRHLMRVLPSTQIVRALVRSGPERWVHRNVHYFDETLKSREEHRTYAAPLRTDDGLRAFTSMLRDTLDVKAMEAFCADLARTPFPIPLMLVYAKEDPMVPPSVGETLRTLVPNARFVQMENASHFAHVDAADRFAALALDFLEPGQ